MIRLLIETGQDGLGDDDVPTLAARLEAAGQEIAFLLQRVSRLENDLGELKIELLTPWHPLSARPEAAQ